MAGDERSARFACEIAPAARDAIAGILDLQELSLRERGGTLSVRFSSDWFEAALTDMPIIVARKGRQVVGYLVSSSKAAQGHVPIIQATLRAYPGAPDSYLYGPVCVAESERGRGLAGKMLSALRARLPGREGITFIRRDNVHSLRAHAKMGMREVAEFADGGAAVVVVAYRG
ncbi:MAG TPA: GNAT family N-acetyltransferase [Hyphomicrobiaceae bacterium]|nr:GNAT family N-acetyltransferase [Hyphomicrobiaceae bacterium]